MGAEGISKSLVMGRIATGIGFYRVIVHVRNLLFAWGWLKTKRLSRPVVSVGNLTVGGTGKTPTCLWLAHALKDRGIRSGILSRGYGRRKDGAMVIEPSYENVMAGSP